MKNDKCEYYRLGSVTLNLDDDCNMIICIDGSEQFDAGHDYKEGYKIFAKLSKQEDIADWDVERFWCWAETCGGIGTPEDNGYRVDADIEYEKQNVEYERKNKGNISIGVITDEWLEKNRK